MIEQGYSEFTPSGNPSTAYDYMKRVEKIRSRENLSINELAENINYYVEKYDSNGDDAEFGKRSHNAFINALKRFEEFVS